LSGQAVDAARPNVSRWVYKRDELAHNSTFAVDDNGGHLYDAIMPKRKEASGLDIDDGYRTGKL
jgi:hypothetical protein